MFLLYLCFEGAGLENSRLWVFPDYLFQALMCNHTQRGLQLFILTCLLLFKCSKLHRVLNAMPFQYFSRFSNMHEAPQDIFNLHVTWTA